LSSLQPILVNLKSNTMKNTLQRYGFLWYLQNIFEQIVAVLTIFCFCVFYKGCKCSKFLFLCKICLLIHWLEIKYAI